MGSTEEQLAPPGAGRFGRTNCPISVADTNSDMGRAVVAHAFNLSQHSGGGRDRYIAVNSRPTWDTEQAPGQPRATQGNFVSKSQTKSNQQEASMLFDSLNNCLMLNIYNKGGGGLKVVAE